MSTRNGYLPFFALSTSSVNVLVEISGIAKGSFTEVSGLDSSIEVIGYPTGDAKENTVRKLAGLRKFSNITLKRDYASDLSLWNWSSRSLIGSSLRFVIPSAARDRGLIYAPPSPLDYRRPDLMRGPATSLRRR